MQSRTLLSPTLRLLLQTVLVATAAACGSPPREEMSESDLEAAAGRLESVPANEAESIAKVVALVEKGVRAEYADLPSGEKIARRDAHGKHHGCVRANFKVESELPADLQSPLFRPGASYGAWIRYSNGSGKPADDHQGDGRGMAIKLIGVPGEHALAEGGTTHDFLMINHSQFFVDTMENYVDFQIALVETKSPLRYFVPSFLNPFGWRLGAAKIARAIQNKKVDSPLNLQYFSMAPSLFNTKAVKWSARPCGGVGPFQQPSASPNYLREAMSKTLSEASACYEFMVQVQTNPQDMPVEDPTVLWNEEDAPFRKIATLNIEKQSFESAEQMTYCENLSFTPWHAIAEHRPLGGLNRGRKVVYETISRVRHELNQAPRLEPEDLEIR